jgi:hypothetical protein
MDGGPIKIGYTENLDARLKQLKAHYGRQLAVLATTEPPKAGRRSGLGTDASGT